ncbi:hypothetical protein BJ742DRAFT_572662 [Cladochytrium replicatum]|nr:hypothetical protein BJ742DRAFT_572662 [Cladochytrium replicatum]
MEDGEIEDLGVEQQLDSTDGGERESDDDGILEWDSANELAVAESDAENDDREDDQDSEHDEDMVKEIVDILKVPNAPPLPKVTKSETSHSTNHSLKPKPTHCIVCSTGPPKYKCPTCRDPYCSVQCYREHQQTPCEPPPTPNPDPDPSAPLSSKDLPEDEKLSVTQLARLSYDPDTRETLRDPHVRDLISNIYSASDDKTRDHVLNMLLHDQHDPRFAKFADAALAAVRGQSK